MMPGNGSVSNRYIQQLLVESGRRLYDLYGLSVEDTGKAMLQMRQQKTGSEFLPLHLHRICAISVVLRHADRDFKWNNYLSHFHERHTDLMDVPAGYQMRASAKLDEVATMLGFPG